MSWAKFDDRYDDNRKVKRAWRRDRATVGLHAMAVTYSCRHRTDGLVDVDWLEEKLPGQRERDKTVAALVDLGLFEAVDAEHWAVHDYLDYNPSSQARTEASNAARNAALVRWSERQDAERNANGNAERIAERNAPGNANGMRNPMPHPSRPVPKEEKRARAALAPSPEGFEEWLLDHSAVTSHSPPRVGTQARKALASTFQARLDENYTLADLKLASRGAHADDHRRENGYDRADSVLRPTKVHDLIERGKRLTASQRTRPDDTDRRLAEADR